MGASRGKTTRAPIDDRNNEKFEKKYKTYAMLAVLLD